MRAHVVVFGCQCIIFKESHFEEKQALISKEEHRTKHIDVRHNLVWEYIENRIVEVIIVRSEENATDQFTKNLIQEIIFQKYALRDLTTGDDNEDNSEVKKYE